MAKKNWIYVKRGLSEDPKHRAQMGEAVWLFLHIIDRADWETGIAFDWKDSQEAADMGISVDTLRRQRQKLEEFDYIRCTQKQRGQEITIMEWRNPRDYGSEIKNSRVPSHESGLTEDLGLRQGSTQGLNYVTEDVKTPTLDSKSLSKSTDEQKAEYLSKAYPEWHLLAGQEVPPEIIEKELQEKAAIDAFESAFGISRPWNWYADERTWKDFRNWVTEKHLKDNNCFTKYVTWRAGKGQYKGAMNNVSIKRNPELFPDSWDMFEAHTAMYGKADDKSFAL